MDMQLVNAVRQHKDILRRATPMRRYALIAEVIGMVILICSTSTGQVLLLMPAMFVMFIAANAKRVWLCARQGLVEAEAAFILDYAINSPYANGLAEIVDSVRLRVAPTFRLAGIACYWRPAFAFTLIAMPASILPLAIFLAGLLIETTWTERLIKSLTTLSRQIVAHPTGKDGNTVTLAA